jgi:hypothetical protein
MTAMVEAEGRTRRAPAALTGLGDASASRDLVELWRGFSRACLSNLLKRKTWLFHLFEFIRKLFCINSFQFQQ